MAAPARGGRRHRPGCDAVAALRQIGDQLHELLRRPGARVHLSCATPVRLPAKSAMPRRPFRVGRSNTGLGLFATRPIRKRTRIAEYKGRKVNTKEANRLEARGNLYLYEINSRWTIDGTPRSNVARYFNHSCNPNAEAVSYTHLR